MQYSLFVGLNVCYFWTNHFSWWHSHGGGSLLGRGKWSKQVRLMKEVGGQIRWCCEGGTWQRRIHSECSSQSGGQCCSGIGNNGWSAELPITMIMRWNLIAVTIHWAAWIVKWIMFPRSYIQVMILNFNWVWWNLRHSWGIKFTMSACSI